MFTVTKRSKWTFDTSGGVSMSAGAGTGGIGTITLKSPAGNSIMYTFAAVGASVGFSVKYGASGSSESFTSGGALYLLDRFGRDELTRDDIEGFFISRDASAALGMGISGSAMLIGIPLSSVPVEVLLQVLRSGDGLADAVGAATGHPLLVKLLMAPTTGASILGAILDKVSPATFESRAKALLLTGGQTAGGLGVGVSATIGYMWAPGVAKFAPDPRQSLPNIDLPIVETVTMRSALSSQDESDVIRLPGDLLFGFDRADIRPAAETALRKAATLIQQRQPRALSVEGHTDAIGEAGYNVVLSNRRAHAVARWLASRKVAKSSAIHTKGWGKMRPVAPNTRPDGSDDPAGRQKNRRVEIWLIR
jgi:outer membrane protein OmpA-like peptidoglycan-associated protein